MSRELDRDTFRRKYTEICTTRRYAYWVSQMGVSSPKKFLYIPFKTPTWELDQISQDIYFSPGAFLRGRRLTREYLGEREVPRDRCTPASEKSRKIVALLVERSIKSLMRVAPRANNERRFRQNAVIDTGKGEKGSFDN